jgi:hypothetical protein
VNVFVVILFFFLFTLVKPSYAYNTEYVALTYKAYDVVRCYSTSSACFNATGRCGFCMHFDGWDDPENQYCWPSLPKSTQQRYYETVFGLKDGATYVEYNACDGLSHFIKWESVFAFDSCGSYSNNNAWVGYDANIYYATHSHVGGGNWTFSVYDYRDLSLVQSTATLDRMDLDLYDWVTTGISVPVELFDAQSFISGSPVGEAYRVVLNPVGTSCHVYDYFSHFDWWIDRDCTQNSLWLMLYDYAWWNIDGLDQFDIQRFQDLAGGLPVVPYKQGLSYGETGRLDKNYKYRIDYTTWDGIAYRFDFVPFCSYVGGGGAGVSNHGEGLSQKGAGVATKELGGYEIRN